ncbi:hypothetical protein [Comamonas sp. 23]|uniref:hypothetical protein n=1 Tax=Comamonas sp. 23 TaxID=3415008 RepID=UPI003C6F66C2
MNLILERTERVRFYTDMRLVFEATGLHASDFDWYISDIDTNCGSDEFSDTDRWLSGVELENFLATRTVQFIWGVFSAFPIGYRRNVEQAPYVDNNPLYWQGVEVSPQLDDALFEVVCWDSSATLLIGLPEEAEKRFKRMYPETRDLRIASQQRNF